MVQLARITPVYDEGPHPLVVAHLDELMVMARARHAEELGQNGKGMDITHCGHGKTWAKCCTVEEIYPGRGVAPGMHLQIMLWYNVGANTHAVALVVPKVEGGGA